MLEILQPVSCDGCGACCMHFDVPPFDCLDPLGDGSFEDREQDYDFSSLPDHLKRELEELYEDHQQPGAHIGGPCPWFDVFTRKCRNYEHRPVICREFPVGCEICLEDRELCGVTNGQ